jgi:hypothetical protein
MDVCWIHIAWIFGPLVGPVVMLFGILGGLFGLDLPFFVEIPLALFCWVGIAKIAKFLISNFLGIIPEALLDLFVKLCWFGAMLAIFFSLNCHYLHILN